MKVKYVPDAKAYEDYYSHTGHGSNYFSGLPVQHGHGLGGILGALTKTIAPVLRRVAVPAMKKVGKIALKRAIPMSKTVARHAVKAGLSGLNDVITQRRSPKQAVATTKARVRKRVAEMIRDELSPDNRRQQQKKNKARSKRQRIEEPDIFTTPH